MPPPLRALVRASGLSRRKAFAAIRSGRVGLEGKTIFDPSSDYTGGALTLDGALLAEPAAAKAYLLLNKPPGYLTTTLDERGRPTVIDLPPAALRVPALPPVGRLARDTSSLLILTNDGNLTYRLTHPKHEVEKEYWAGLAAAVDDERLGGRRPRGGVRGRGGGGGGGGGGA